MDKAGQNTPPRKRISQSLGQNSQIWYNIQNDPKKLEKTGKNFQECIKLNGFDSCPQPPLNI